MSNHVSLLGVESGSSGSMMMMQIFIKTANGRQLALEARYTDTVASVKAQIQDKEGIPPAQQCLVYDRMALDDARTLAGCGVQRESTLHLHLPGSTMSGAGAMPHRGRRCDAAMVLGVVSLCLGIAALGMGSHVGDKSSSDNAAALDRLKQLESQLEEAKAALHSELEQLKGSTASELEQLKGSTASELEQLKDSTAVARKELVPYGSIVLWNSTRQSIPVGWVECDGQHGTPDLRDRFVVGAGTRFPQGEDMAKGVQHNATFNWYHRNGGRGNHDYYALNIDFGEPIPAHHALVYIMRAEKSTHTAIGVAEQSGQVV
eukprot:COSAG01_NODE_2983_length_6754_cov_3.914651_6_plen_318_part_00